MVEVHLKCVDCGLEHTITPNGETWCDRELLAEPGTVKYGFNGNFVERLYRVAAPKGWSMQRMEAKCPDCYRRREAESAEASRKRRIAEQQAREAKACEVVGSGLPAIQEELVEIAGLCNCSGWHSASERLKSLLAAMGAPDAT